MQRRSKVNLHIQLGATVHTADQARLGRIEGIVIDPLTRDVSHIVVKRGWLSSRNVIAPIDAIRSAHGEQIELDDNGDDAEYPPLTRVTYVKEGNEPISDRPVLYQQPAQFSSPTVWLTPPGGGTRGLTTGTDAVLTESLPDRAVTLEASTPVYAVGRRVVGSFAGVIASPLRQVTHLMVDSRARAGFIVVPAQWVGDLTPAEVRLSVTTQLVAASSPLPSRDIDDGD